MEFYWNFILTFLVLFFSLTHLLKLFTAEKNMKKKKKKKNHLPPSPPSLPIVGHLHRLKKPLHQSLARLSSQHGPLLHLRFGTFPALLVSSYPLAEECFTTNDTAFANRPNFPSTQLTSYNHTSIPFAAYGPEWRDMRRIASMEALTSRRLASFSGVRDKEAGAFVRNLFKDTASLAGGEFTLVGLKMRLFGMAMNMMMGIIDGNRYYWEDEAMDLKVKRFKEAAEESLIIAGGSSVGDFLPPVIGWAVSHRVKKKIAWIYERRDDFVQSIVDTRRKERGVEAERTAKTVIDSLLALQEKQPHHYNDHFIKALITSLLLAGTDTTSNAIEWALSLLLNYPEKLQKARQEIDEQVGSNRLLEEADLIKLPYLCCIIRETLRMYPIGPVIIHESREDCTVGGYHVSKGTMLLVNVYAIQRDPAVWSEPMKFLPERFQAAEETGKMLSFGMGRRRCPGEGLAMREIGLVLGALVQCFDWRRATLQEVDMEQGQGITMPKANPLKALCRPRKSMMNALSHL